MESWECRWVLKENKKQHKNNDDFTVKIVYRQIVKIALRVSKVDGYLVILYAQQK